MISISIRCAPGPSSLPFQHQVFNCDFCQSDGWKKSHSVISIFWIKFIIFHFNWLWISFTINFHFTYFSVHTSCFFLTDLWNLFAYEENQSCINQIVKNTFSTLYHSYDTEVLNLDIKSIDFGFKVLCPSLLQNYKQVIPFTTFMVSLSVL